MAGDSDAWHCRRHEVLLVLRGTQWEVLSNVLSGVVDSFSYSVLLRRSPSTRNFDPFREARAFLAFDVSNISVASTATTNSVLFWWIWSCPIFVFFLSFLYVFCGLLKPRYSWQLSCRCICWAVLNSGMSVSEVSEIVYIFC